MVFVSKTFVRYLIALNYSLVDLFKSGAREPQAVCQGLKTCPELASGSQRTTKRQDNCHPDNKKLKKKIITK